MSRVFFFGIWSNFNKLKTPDQWEEKNSNNRLKCVMRHAYSLVRLLYAMHVY